MPGAQVERLLLLRPGVRKALFISWPWQDDPNRSVWRHFSEGQRRKGSKSDAEAGVNFQRYTTLVLKDFQNGVGDALPARVLQDLPEAAMAHLNECYLGAFGKIERTATGSAEELVVGGTITEYREGSRFARAMLIGLGSA